MVQYRPLDRAFAALSDPTRRGILERLEIGAATISQLAEPFGMSLTAVKKHVRVLEDAGLVTTRKVGRSRECTLGPERLDDATRWIESHRGRWQRRLERLDDVVQRREEQV